MNYQGIRYPFTHLSFYFVATKYKMPQCKNNINLSAEVKRKVIFIYEKLGN